MSEATTASATATMTRRRGHGVGEGDVTKDDAAVLELSRWTLQDETKPLTNEYENNNNTNNDDVDVEIAKRNNNNDTDDHDDDDAPLTVKLMDYLRKEQEEEYTTWQRGISSAMEEIVGRGDVGTIVLREALTDGRIRFVILFRFRNRSAARTWHTSTVRHTWLRKLTESTFHNPTNDPHRYDQNNTDTSPIPIFDVTPKDAIIPSMFTTEQQQPQQPQQRWRTAFLVWIQVFVLVEFFGIVIPFIVGPASWYSINFHLQLVIGTALTTLVIEAITMRIFITVAQKTGFLHSN